MTPHAALSFLRGALAELAASDPGNKIKNALDSIEQGLAPVPGSGSDKATVACATDVLRRISDRLEGQRCAASASELRAIANDLSAVEERMR